MNDKIQLYTIASPNGRKPAILFEELGLEYDAHKIDITKGEQFKDEFVSISPYAKVPAVIDPTGDDGRPLSIFESSAILLHFAEKTGKLISNNPALRSETQQWLFLQTGSIAPSFGQFGHFHKYAKDQCADPYPSTRFLNDTQRLLTILDNRLAERQYLVGDEYSIADIAIFPWIGCLSWGYDAAEFLNLKQYTHLMAWYEQCVNRPASILGAKVCPF